jgi:hypothetical protein
MIETEVEYLVTAVYADSAGQRYWPNSEPP